MSTHQDLASVEAHLDPKVREAADEVDDSLLDWMLSLSPTERLRAVSKASAALSRFRRASS